MSWFWGITQRSKGDKGTVISNLLSNGSGDKIQWDKMIKCGKMSVDESQWSVYRISTISLTFL